MNTERKAYVIPLVISKKNLVTEESICAYKHMYDKSTKGTIGPLKLRRFYEIEKKKETNKRDSNNKDSAIPFEETQHNKQNFDKQLPMRRQEDIEATITNVPQNTDDTDMKKKLFSLMHESIRDSDLKIKRAQLLKHNYENSSVFQIGYLMGDITDKYNIMTDVSMTMKENFNEWKPMEHINAYEQIANQAIEVSHLIDLIKTIHKQNGTAL
ncbi:uncharacterized protein LOC131849015 [Achroia grisella]|uniref:uncharacterized protein LOC131849015 n=1 Tax=Achroia grisella TaxID=688607 RepID=UPI0027D241F3|nr:uncharacterized protein LOC131849015 [Achroia grisella]